ncbi:MAG: BON domain-containing protein [Betaproteobacteria bacterium]|jgi:osmotically-inducible protein OsmY|nr:BON domain-containing protein [Betaproteobacteria bacterium]
MQVCSYCLFDPFAGRFAMSKHAPFPVVPNNARRLALASIGLAALGLSGCVGVAVTGAAVGAVATGDRRSLGTQADDQTIEFRVRSAVSAALPNSNVRAVSYNRKVLLIGQVVTEADKKLAQEVAARVNNVASVINEVEIRPLASAQNSAVDIALSTKVRAAFIEDKSLEIGAFRISSELGVVFLMGQVSKREGERAAQVASKVSGVRRVVTLFDYVG